MIDLHDQTDGSQAINFYMNHAPQLEHFFRRLKYQFADLIDQAARQPMQADRKYIPVNHISSHGARLTLYWKKQTAVISKQEYICLKHLAKGLRPKQISQLENISSRTVECYLNRIKGKLDIHSTRELITCYWENHIFDN